MASSDLRNEGGITTGPPSGENNDARSDIDAAEITVHKSRATSAVNKDDRTTALINYQGDQNENGKNLIDSFPPVNKNGRPKLSFIALIHLAIQQSKEQKLTLRGILNFIEDNFAYYRNKRPQWHASIRHNLSLNDCFIKVQRPPGDKGHGSYWMLDPEATNMYEHGSFQRRRTRYTKNMIDEASPKPKAASSSSSNRWKTSQNASGSLQDDISSNQKNLSLISGENTTANSQKSSAVSSSVSSAPPRDVRTGFQSSFSIDSLLSEQPNESPAPVLHPRSYFQELLSTVPSSFAIPQRITPPRYPLYLSSIDVQSILGSASQPRPRSSPWQRPRSTYPARIRNVLRSTGLALMLPRWHPYSR